MNEETRLIDPIQENNNVPAPAFEENQEPASNNGKKAAAVIAGVAAGGAVGVAAAAGAAYMFDQNEEVEAEVVETDANDAQTTVQHETVVHHVQEPAHHGHANAHAHAHAQHPQQHAPNQQHPSDAIPENATITGENTATATTTNNNHNNHNQDPAKPVTQETGGEAESDVHVIGIDVIETGEDQEGIIAVLEDRADGQLAAVIDADADGTVDVLVVDTNHNQRFDSEDSFQDIHDQGYQTMDFVDAYAQEQANESGNDLAYNASNEREASFDYADDQASYEAETYDTGNYEAEAYEQEAYVAQDDYSSDYSADADAGYIEA